MNCNQALVKSRVKRIVGLIIGLPALLSLSVSVLKFLYFGIDNGSSMGSMLATPCKWFVHWVYTHTPFLGVFWENSPVPTHATLATLENLYFAGAYAAIFIAMALRAAGHTLARRSAKMREMLNQQIISAPHPNMARSLPELEQTVTIPDASIFKQTRQLYMAPLVTAVIGAVLFKLAGF